MNGRSATRKLQAQQSAIDGGYAGLEVGGQKTSVNAQNRRGIDHRGKKITEERTKPPRTHRAPVQNEVPSGCRLRLSSMPLNRELPTTRLRGQRRPSTSRALHDLVHTKRS